MPHEDPHAREQRRHSATIGTVPSPGAGALKRRSFVAGLVAAGLVGGVTAVAADRRSNRTPAPTQPAPTEPKPPEPAPSALVCPVPPDDRDTTTEIATWIAGLPAGATVTFAASQGRVYRIDRSLAVTGKTRLTVQDAAFRVAAPSTELDARGRSTRRHLWFTECTDLVLDRVSVRGQNLTADDGTPIDETGQATYDPFREWEHAVAVEDCERVTVHRFTADAVFGDGAYWRRVTDGRLDGFTVSRNGRQGVAVIATRGMQIVNGTITHSRRSGIDLEPNVASEVIEDVEIGHIRMRSRLVALNASGPGTVRNVHVHDVVTTSGSVPSLSLVSGSGARRDDWTVERWTSTAELGSPLAVIRAHDAAGLVMRDFQARCSPLRLMTGVELLRPGPVRLEGCAFDGAARLVTVSEPAADHSLRIVDCLPEA